MYGFDAYEYGLQVCVDVYIPYLAFLRRSIYVGVLLCGAGALEEGKGGRWGGGRGGGGRGVRLVAKGGG